MRVSNKYKYCLNCGKLIRNKFISKTGNTYSLGNKRWEEIKYCSHKCFGKVDGLARIGKNEQKHPKWKGDKVGYFGVHDWITKHFGQPIGCEVCGLHDTKRKYHWANLSGEYKRDRNDFMRMCVSCHRKFDYRRKRA